MEDFTNQPKDEKEEVSAEASEEINVAEDEQEEDGTLMVSSKSSIKKEILDWVISIAVALVIALLIRNYICAFVRVSGPSMEPTLQHNDLLYVNRFLYTPENGDVIIFRPDHSPKTPYVKRVVATEGQTVVIDETERAVYVDGEKLNEDYIKDRLVSDGNMTYPYTVPEGHVFVLGDNRNNSVDSRDSKVGAVSLKSIVGKVLFRLVPFSKLGSIYN